MKPYVGIHQERIIKFGLTDMTFDHGAILDFICNIQNWNNVKMLVQNHEIYYWVSYDLIIKNLPMLKCKKDTVYRKVKDLVQMGLIEFHPESQKLGMTYIRVTDKTRDLCSLPSDDFRSTNTGRSDPSDKFPEGSAENRLGIQENAENNLNNPRIEIRTPSDLKPEYKTIEDKTIENKEKNKKEIPDFITEEYLQSLAQDVTVDHDGQPYVLRPFQFLIKLDYEAIRKELFSKETLARVRQDYAEILRFMMTDRYTEEQKAELDRMEAGLE